MENQIYKDFCMSLVSNECFFKKIIFYYTCINMSHIIA